MYTIITESPSQAYKWFLGSGLGDDALQSRLGAGRVPRDLVTLEPDQSSFDGGMALTASVLVTGSGRPPTMDVYLARSALMVGNFNPLVRKDLDRRLLARLTYFAYFEPHRRLGVASPAEVYFNARPAHLSSVAPPTGRPGERPTESPLDYKRAEHRRERGIQLTSQRVSDFWPPATSSFGTPLSFVPVECDAA